MLDSNISTRMLLLFILATASVFVPFSAGYPHFQWLNKVSDFGVPLLKVTWDEQGSDAIHFTKYWKTFKNVKGCNLEGYLEKEPVLSVFLTRGCPLDKSFHLQVQPKSNTFPMNIIIKVVDGVAKSIEVTASINITKNIMDIDSSTIPENFSDQKDSGKTPDCKCGDFNLDEFFGQKAKTKHSVHRILGGSPAPPHSLPHQVGLWSREPKRQFCGGTLISPNFVLTAAHCVEKKYETSSLMVSVGDVYRKVLGDSEMFIAVAKIKGHPGFNKDKYDNDFALLQLATSVPVSSIANYACLPMDVLQSFENERLIVSGWGREENGGKQSNALKAMISHGISNRDCQEQKMEKFPPITKNVICTAFNFKTSGVCEGDSGGPLTGLVNGRPTVVGVTSFNLSSKCGELPSAFARVSAQLDWILENSDAGSCQV